MQVDPRKIIWLGLFMIVDFPGVMTQPAWGNGTSNSPRPIVRCEVLKAGIKDDALPIALSAATRLCGAQTSENIEAVDLVRCEDSSPFGGERVVERAIRIQVKDLAFRYFGDHGRRLCSVHLVIKEDSGDFVLAYIDGAHGWRNAISGEWRSAEDLAEELNWQTRPAQLSTLRSSLQDLGEASGVAFQFDPAEAGQIIFRARTVEHVLPDDVKKANSVQEAGSREEWLIEVRGVVTNRFHGKEYTGQLIRMVDSNPQEYVTSYLP